MHLSCRSSYFVLAISLLPACPSQDGGGETTDQPSTTTEATTGLTSSSSDTGPTTGATSDASTSDATTSDATTSDTEGPLPAECEQSEPVASAAVEVVIEGWPVVNPKWYDFDVQCVLDEVATDAGLVTTTLTCEVEGASLPAIVRMPEAPEGEVAWEAGRAVQLTIHAADDPDFGITDRRLLLRDASDDAPLAAWLDFGWTGPDPSGLFPPFTFAFEYACGLEDEVLRVDLGIPDGATTSIFSGQRGQLPIDASHIYAIDVEEATGNLCCHFSEQFRILARRVVTGG